MIPAELKSMFFLMEGVMTVLFQSKHSEEAGEERLEN